MEAGLVQDSSPPRAGRSGVERHGHLIVATLLLAFLVLGWRGRMPVHLAFDELIYVSLSQSLEEGSYREAYAVNAPRHVRYPPGYPAWLMTLRQLGGESHDLVQAFNLAFIAIAILSVYLILRHISGVGIGLAAAFLLAFNPALLEMGATLLSEAPFIGLSSAALAFAVLSPPRSSGRAYLAIALAMASFLTRVAGVTVVIAVGLWLWQRRRRSELIAFGLATLIVVGGWFAYASLVPTAEASGSYADDVSGANLDPRHPGLTGKLTRAANFGFSYLTQGLPSALAFPTIPGTGIDNLLWLVAAAGLGLAGMVVLWRSGRPVLWHLALSAVMILAWPWRLERLLVPMVPLVIAAILLGADRLTRTLPAPRRNLILAGLTLLMATGTIKAAWERDVQARACDRSIPFQSEGCYSVESRNLAAASHYLRDHAPPDAVVLTVSGAAVNYLSGLLTSPAGQFKRSSASPPTILRELGVSYILITGHRQFEKQHLGPWLLGACRHLRVEARFPPGGFILTPEAPQSPSEEACAPLTRLVSTPREPSVAPPEPESQ